MSKRRFTQNYASGVEEEDTRLNVFYCLHCGSFSLILGEPLSDLPRRRTDGSHVLDESRILRKNMREGDVKVVKRVNGLERQYRLECPECNLFIAYRPNDHNAEGKLIYVLPEALGTRQELAGAIKHHSIEELKGQLASLLTKFPNGVLLSVLRKLFREHFGHDLDEREYGDYGSMEDLIIKALPDVARLDTLPQAGSDMLILSVASSLSSSTENLPSNQLVTVNNTTIPPVTNTDLPIPSTSTQITVSLSSSAPPQSQSPSQAQSQLLPTAPPAPEDVPTLLDQLKPKLEMDANAPKPRPTDLIFKPTAATTTAATRSIITMTIKANPKQNTMTRTKTNAKATQPLQQPSQQHHHHQQQQQQQQQQQEDKPLFALVSSDYD